MSKEKRLTATIRVTIDQYIDLTEDQLRSLESHLEDSDSVVEYTIKDGKPKLNEVYDILTSKIDLKEAEFDEIEDIVIE